MALFVAEIKKLMAKSFGLLLLVSMLVLKIITLGFEDSKTNAYLLEYKTDYLSIVNRYTGKVTQDVSDQIEAENALVLRADTDLRRLRLDYYNGLMTTEAFERDLPGLETLSKNKELFLSFYSQYLTAKSEPDTRFILYSEGWDRFFSTNRLDWFSSLGIIIFAALIFGKEYEADMRKLQISTSKGDVRLVLTKFLVLFTVIIAIGVFSFLCEFLFFHSRYGLPNGNFPYQSIAIFRNSPLPLTLMQASLLTFLLRLLGFCILGIVTIAISIAFQSVIPSLISGLTAVALPFALPVSSASKVFLPSPYSLIIATPFLYGAKDPLLEKNTFSFINQVGNDHLLGIILLWLFIAVLLLLYIRRKFGYVRYKPRGSKATLILWLIMTLVLFGCHAPVRDSSQKLTVNFSTDFLYTYKDPYVVSLFPAFMMEDINNASLTKINRDPFLNKDFVDTHFAGMFIEDDVLYYAIKTFDYQQIRSVNLSNWDTKVVYTRYPQQQVSIINDDLENHSGSQGKSSLPFMVYDNKIFLLDEEELIMINSGSSKEVPVINKISQEGGVAFKDGKFYYINNVNELRTYSLLDGSDQPLHGIKAIFQLQIRGNLLYFQNLNRGLTLFSLNLDTDEIKQVLDAEIGYHVCDDSYVYYSNPKDNGFLYRADLKTGEPTFIAPIEMPLNIQVLPGKPFLYVRAYDPSIEGMATYRVDTRDWSYERLKHYEDFNEALK